jgi:hypothetical protein
VNDKKPFIVKIHWGERATRLENDAAITYSFYTVDELNAFLEGVSEGAGWLDHEMCDKGCETCGELAARKVKP